MQIQGDDCGQGRVLIGQGVSQEAFQATSHEKFCAGHPADVARAAREAAGS
jgi:hypothetical protein